MYIVLVTRGKHESVDYVTVKLFEEYVEAVAFCRINNTGKGKHWVNAEFVCEGTELELTPPQE